MANQLTQQTTTTVEATKIVTVEYLMGPDEKGPERCIHCYRLFQEGEVWRRYTAPPDPECGTYSIGVPDACAQYWPMR